MNDLQRTEEWYLDRRGKVTASEIYLLLADHKEPMTEEELAAWKTENPKSRVTTKNVPFSDGTFTYLGRKVAEMYMPDDGYLMYIEQLSGGSAATRWGTALEDEARSRYMEEMGISVEDSPFMPLPDYGRFAGGSPDGRIEGGIIEIKCPYNPAVHVEHYLLQSGEELKELNLQYYCQCQFNMMCCGVDFCDFISYDPRVSRDKQIKILRIYKDEETQAMLLERVRLAVDYFKQKINEIEKTQWKKVEES